MTGNVLLPGARARDVFEDWEKVGGVYLPARLVEPAPPLAMDLFAGAGGFSCGFHQAGWHVVAAAEWWPCAVTTYVCNLGAPDTLIYVGETVGADWTKKERAALAPYHGEFITAVEFFELTAADLAPGDGWIKSQDGPAGMPCEVMFCCDVRELTGEFVLEALGLDRGELGCVMGGPPCQGFSVAGDQDVNDPRNELVFEFARVVCELSPRTMVMITNMVTPEGLPVLDALTLALESGGMGELDALRKSLRMTSGVGAAVKGAKKVGRKSKHQDDDDAEFVDADEQLTIGATS